MRLRAEYGAFSLPYSLPTPNLGTWWKQKLSQPLKKEVWAPLALNQTLLSHLSTVLYGEKKIGNTRTFLLLFFSLVRGGFLGRYPFTRIMLSE